MQANVPAQIATAIGTTRRGGRASKSIARQGVNLLRLGSAHCKNTVVAVTDTNAVATRQILRSAIHGYETS
jgi:hypothetical protein